MGCGEGVERGTEQNRTEQPHTHMCNQQSSWAVIYGPLHKLHRVFTRVWWKTETLLLVCLITLGDTSFLLCLPRDRLLPTMQLCSDVICEGAHTYSTIMYMHSGFCKLLLLHCHCFGNRTNCFVNIQAFVIPTTQPSIDICRGGTVK